MRRFRSNLSLHMTANTLSHLSEIVIEIGGVPIQLRMRDNAFHELLSTRYAGFLCASSSPRISLEVEFALDAKIADGDVEVRVRQGRWFMQRADFMAEFDPANGQGRIRQSANPYSIDTILRILHGLMLVREGGFLLHAASAI